jgi:N-acetylneuraminic acid mutarotase
MKTISLVSLVLLSASIFAFPADKPPLTKAWWKTPDTLSWSSLPNTIQGCSYTAGAYLDGNFYQICGMDPNTLMYPYMQVFNGSSWSLAGWHPAGGISNHSAAVWNNKIVVSGGYIVENPHYFGYTTVFSPSDNSWIQSTPMAVPNNLNTAMACVNGKCYIFGGNITPTSTYYWTPGDANMLPRAAIPNNRSAASAAVYNGKIYLFGGNNTSILLYDPDADSWTTKTAVLNPMRNRAVAVTIGDLIYIIGGLTGSSVLNEVKIYNPINDTITDGPPLPYITFGHAAAGTLIPNGKCTTYTGKIYVSGGSNTIMYDMALLTAELGTVTGVNPVKVEPTSLGNIKALYH